MPKNKSKKPACPGQSTWLSAGIKVARIRGLYLVEDGDPANPEWRIYSRQSGRPIVWYAPASGRYRVLRPFGDESGVNQHFNPVFDLAQSLDRK